MKIVSIHFVHFVGKTGLPNSNFENQGFFVKYQEFFRRIFALNQEKNQEYFLLKVNSHLMVLSHKKPFFTNRHIDRVSNKSNAQNFSCGLIKILDKLLMKYSCECLTV